MLKLLKNKKGTAMESAIVMLVVVFALCTLLVASTLMIRKMDINENLNTAAVIVVDNIGEEFVRAVRNGTAREYKTTDDRFLSNVSWAGDTYTMTLTRIDGREHALTVSARYLDGDVVITAWQRFRE